MRVVLLGETTSATPAIAPFLAAHDCQILPYDSTLSSTALRDLDVDLCIVDLSEPAASANNLLRRIPATLPVIAVVNGSGRELDFTELFDVLFLPIDTLRLKEDLDYLRSALRPGDPLPPPPDDAEIEEFSEFIHEQCGLHFDQRNRKTLERCIQRRMRVVAAPTLAAYRAYLHRFQESRQELKKLASLLTIGETSFFRFDPHFAALTELVIPELLKRNQPEQRLKIWSAGCSTGEEVYSLAIILLQHFPQLADWDVTILGTDISHQSLSIAEQGTYQGRTLRNVPADLLSEWFVKNGKEWTVSDRLRAITRFAFLNLQSESYPNPNNGTTECDLIFCRNVMIYFRPETVRAVVSRLRRALRPGSYLFLGHAETLGTGFLDFVRCQHHGGTYYRAGTIEEDEEKDIPPQAPTDPDEKKNEALLPFVEDHKIILQPPEEVREQEKRSPDLILSDIGREKETPPKTAEPPPREVTPANDLLEQGFSLADQGRFDEALALCQQLLQKDDLFSRGYLLRGLIRDQQGQSLAAIADYQRAILLDLKGVMAHYYLAGAYRQIGRKDEALRSLETTARLLAKMGEKERVPDAKDWTVKGLLERCRTEVKQLDQTRSRAKDKE